MDDLQTQSLAADTIPSWNVFSRDDSSNTDNPRPRGATMFTPHTPSLAAFPTSSALGTMVVIGASSPALLCGLESLVSETAGLSLAGTACSLDRFLECCALVRTGVALVDPFIGRQHIREFMEALGAAAPRIRAVLMTDANQPHIVREAVKSGACGFVGQTAATEEIRAALSAAAAGRRHISAGVAAHLAESLTLEDLTNREMQVLGLLSLGDCNKAIARDLDVTVGTVKTHVRAIMSKLSSRSRTEAVHKAYRLGLVCLDS